MLNLAYLMRARVAARAGLPPPPIQARRPVARRSSRKLGNFIDDMGGTSGCFDSALAIAAMVLLLTDLVWGWLRA